MSITDLNSDRSELMEFETELETKFIWSARVNARITLRGMMDERFWRQGT